MRVLIESPFAGEVARNLEYLNRAIKDSITRGEAPFASHFIYPRFLDDALATERDLGIKMGYDWMAVADAVIFYCDYGWSPGMRKAKKRALKLGKMIAHRKIGRNS